MKNSTPVPNILFDQLLPYLSPAETKIVLVVIRQTIGWYDRKTGKRKKRDWISHGQFALKTRLSRKTISQCINTLVQKEYLIASDHKGRPFRTAQERKGKTRIYYAFNQRLYDPTQAREDSILDPFTQLLRTKEKPTKEEDQSKKYPPGQKIPDHIRIQELQKQQERDSWYDGLI